MANVIQDPADTTMMMMMDNDNGGGGESSSMMMMNLPIEDDGVDDNAMMDDDDVDLICPSGCTTITQCEEDRILLEAFLNETDIDLIENPPSAAAAAVALTASGTSTGRNVRQVSDGTNSQATISTTIPNLPAPPTPEPPATTIPPPTGRPPIQLYLSCNPDYLSEYQCLIRKNIELFEATEVDVTSRIKGRNKPIVLGQVGIRCIHCKYIHPQQRGRGAMYYPHKLSGIYQAAQILSQGHLMDGGNNNGNDGGGGKSIICGHVPQSLQQELIRLKAMKSVMTTAGKDYWAGTAQALGVYEDEYGLRFEERLGMVRHPHHPH